MKQQLFASLLPGDRQEQAQGGPGTPVWKDGDGPLTATQIREKVAMPMSRGLQNEGVIRQANTDTHTLSARDMCPSQLWGAASGFRNAAGV